jgi:hypothetical protein
MSRESIGRVLFENIVFLESCPLGRVHYIINKENQKITGHSSVKVVSRDDAKDENLRRVERTDNEKIWGRKRVLMKSVMRCHVGVNLELRTEVGSKCEG